MSQAPLPIIQSIPHSGLATPPEVADRLALKPAAIYNECDLWADQLYDFAHADLDAVTPDSATGARGVLDVIITPIARALVDVNRLPDDLDNPDGPIKSQTSYGEQVYISPLSQVEKTTLLDRYWRSYHSRLEESLRRHADDVLLLLDCHNMAQHGPPTYAFAGAPRPLICLANLGDAQGEPTAPGARVTCPGWLLRAAGGIAAELFSDLTLLQPTEGEIAPVVALNWPFVGGILIDRYTRDLRGDLPAPLPQAPCAMMVEVNRGLFVGDQRVDTPIAPANLERIALIRQRLHRWIVQVVEIAQLHDIEDIHWGRVHDD
jgi:N-formylglutamate amidohydrolase